MMTWLSYCSVQQAQPLVQRDLPTQPGLLSYGARGTIFNRSLPNPAWIAPEDLQKPFKYTFLSCPQVLCAMLPLTPFACMQKHL